MTLKELLDATEDDMVLLLLKELYPETSENILEYKRVLVELRGITPELPVGEELDYMQGMYLTVDTYDDPPFLVNGKNGLTKREWASKEGISYREHPGLDELESFGLDMTPWKNWLAMPVSKDTHTKWLATGVVVHCLVEMTRSGMTEDQIERNKNSLKKLIALGERQIAQGKTHTSEEVYEKIMSRFR